MVTQLLIVIFLLVFDEVSLQVREAKEFLDDYNKNFAKYIYAKNEAMFARSVNITEFNTKKEKEMNEKYRIQLRKIRKKARTLDLTDCDDDTKRQFKLLLKTKESLNMTTAKKVEDLLIEMRMISENTTVPTSLKNAWLSEKYENFVKLNNMAARENGYRDAGEYFRNMYDTDGIDLIAAKLLKDMQPFYLELHGFVRHHLRRLHPKLIDPLGPIPADLMGSMIAPSFEGLYGNVAPYPNEPSIDVSESLRKNKTVLEMVRIAEEFFTSLGWEKLPTTFWNHSLFEYPSDRRVDCFPSALDLIGEINGIPDVRIKMCIWKSQYSFLMIHHEIGHMYYSLLYKDQPLEYRDGANPAIHESIGDFISLSVQTPAHLHRIGLLEENSQTEEADVNFLLKTALQQVSFLPFAFVVDYWRWKVYSGDIKRSEYNNKWWEYREKYQGISKPGQSKATYFEPFAIHHIVTDVPYIRYFFGTIFMFTFHKRACDLSGNTKLLHQCSIYNSKNVGREFAKMLALGKSKPWPEALKIFTGSDELSINPVNEYFRPFIGWLREYRRTHNYEVGWNNETYVERTN